MTVDGAGAERITELLRRDAGKLTQRWVELAGASLRGRMSESELHRECDDMFELLVAAVSRGGRLIDDESFAEVRAFLNEMSRSRARLGFSPTETAVNVFALKQAVFEQLEQTAEGFREVIAFSQMLDGIGLWTFECYSRTRDEIITEQSAQLLELTTPVVKVWDGVLAVPLVGTLDSARTHVVMEKLLQTLVDTGAEQAIIDITGVLAVDTQVAQYLLKTVMAARLMGATCTISGIRPQIAQTIVGLGIEFGDITTKASLADALAHSLRLAGMDVVRRPGQQVG